MIIANKKGFTLIEMLIAIALIGIVFSMMGLATYLTKNDEISLRETTYQIYNAILIAQDSAITQGKYYAIMINQHHMQLYQLARESTDQVYWTNAELPGFFQKITLPDTIKLSFSTSLNKQEKTLYAFNIQPDIIFSPDGTITPFKMTLYAKESKPLSNWIQGNQNGAIKMAIQNEVVTQSSCYETNFPKKSLQCHSGIRVANVRNLIKSYNFLVLDSGHSLREFRNDVVDKLFCVLTANLSHYPK